MLPSPDKQFHGEISQVNIFSHALDAAAISAIAKNCTIKQQQTGNIFEWLDFDDIYGQNDVNRVEPSICGDSNCSPGFTGSLCDIKMGKLSLQPYILTLNI